jgi:hypothetical protein
MSQTPKSAPSSLSEISHLFLTDLRQRQVGPASRPVRKPPSGAAKPAVSIDVTPEEFSRGLAADGLAAPAQAQDWRQPGLSLVVAHHLGTSALERVRQYARHMAAEAGRIGLIELGDDGLRLSSIDASPLSRMEAQAEAAQVEPVDGKRIRQAIEEMSWDIDRWLLYLPAGTGSAAGARTVQSVNRWTLLVGADDEGLVAGYRILKGLSPIDKTRQTSLTLSLAVLDAEDEAQAKIVHQKLSGASRRFLGLAVENEGQVQSAAEVSEHVVLWCRASTNSPTQDHWTAVAELAAKSCAAERGEFSAAAAEAPVEIESEWPQPQEAAAAEQPEPEPIAMNPIPISAPIDAAEPVMKIPVESGAWPKAAEDKAVAEVIELSIPEGADIAEAILAAVAKGQTQWIAAPLKPPMCPTATVAVDRAGRLTLLAVAASGLSELRALAHREPGADAHGAAADEHRRPDAAKAVAAGGSG